MQWLTLVSEDNGVQRLKAANRKPAVARAIDPVSASPSTQPARVGEYPETPHLRIGSQHQGERRKDGERRRKQVPVILDTRSKHDRRGLQNRCDTQRGKEKPDTPRPRINVYA